jgi:hypothetical protein
MPLLTLRPVSSASLVIAPLSLWCATPAAASVTDSVYHALIKRAHHRRSTAAGDECTHNGVAPSSVALPCLQCLRCVLSRCLRTSEPGSWVVRSLTRIVTSRRVRCAKAYFCALVFQPYRRPTVFDLVLKNSCASCLAPCRYDFERPPTACPLTISTNHVSSQEHARLLGAHGCFDAVVRS